MHIIYQLTSYSEHEYVKVTGVKHALFSEVEHIIIEHFHRILDAEFTSLFYKPLPACPQATYEEYGELKTCSRENVTWTFHNSRITTIGDSYNDPFQSSNRAGSNRV